MTDLMRVSAPCSLRTEIQISRRTTACSGMTRIRPGTSAATNVGSMAMPRRSRGVALGEDAVAVETDLRRLDQVVEPSHRVDRQQVVDVGDEHMVLEIVEAARQPVHPRVGFRAVEKQRNVRDLAAGKPGRRGLKKLRNMSASLRERSAGCGMLTSSTLTFGAKRSSRPMRRARYWLAMPSMVAIRTVCVAMVRLPVRASSMEIACVSMLSM